MMSDLQRRIFNALVTLTLTVGTAVALFGCEKKSGPEEVGEEVGEAIEEAGEEMQRAAK
jgi:hypothetical protein